MRRLLLLVVVAILLAVVAIWALELAGGSPGQLVERFTDRALRAPFTAGATGYLGVDLLELTPQLRRHFGAPPDAGLLVAAVDRGAPGARAGLQVGDVLTRVGGREVATVTDLRRALSGWAGREVELELTRAGARRRLAATPGPDEIERRDPVEGGRLSERIRALGERAGILPELSGVADGVAEMDPERIVQALDDALRSGRLPDRSREEELEGRIRELERRLQELEQQRQGGPS